MIYLSRLAYTNYYYIVRCEHGRQSNEFGMFSDAFVYANKKHGGVCLWEIIQKWDNGDSYTIATGN